MHTSLDSLTWILVHWETWQVSGAALLLLQLAATVTTSSSQQTAASGVQWQASA
jgi:hypothetical protein